MEHPLRCFTYRRGLRGPYIAECVDLDILSQGDTLEEAIGKLQEAVFSYLDVAFAGNTEGLVPRPSPGSHWLRYRLHRLAAYITYKLRHHRASRVFTLSARDHNQLSHC